MAPRIGHDVTQCLRAVAAQTATRDDILLVGSGSDALMQLISEFPNARLVPAPLEATVSERRRLGARTATRDIVAFLDDDLVVDAGWLAALREAAADVAVAAFCGPVRVGRTPVGVTYRTNEIGRMLADGRLTGGFDLDPGQPVDVDDVPSANYAVRRTDLDAVGGIDARFPDAGRYADTDLAVRLRLAGRRIMYIPEAAGARPTPPHRRVSLRSLYQRRRAHMTMLAARVGVFSPTARYYAAGVLRDQRQRLREAAVLTTAYRDRADGTRRPWRRRLDAPVPVAAAAMEMAGIVAGAVQGTRWRHASRRPRG
ncbi:glycosyltransferase family 2 protein [Microbacterium kribbense]|uniref:glycosyltransferase family 2 protein n=1 Tax=Microbacterium kribbense TaxID=433645 RepID=UPI003CD09338